MTNIKFFLLNGMRIIGFSLLGGIIGIILGLFIFSNFIPFWKHYDIPPTSEKTIGILFVDYQSTLDDPMNDILYVKSKSGKVYFIHILQGNWQTLESFPKGEISQIRTQDDYANSPLIATTEQGDFYQLANGQWNSIPVIKEPRGGGPERVLCATEWQDHPLLNKNILDSAGVRFERPLSTILRCYVLFDDGSIQVWTRWTDVFDLMTTIATSAIIGLLLGVISSIFFFGFKNRKFAGTET